GPCREVRYTAAGPAFLTGDWKDPADWTMSFVDPDKNAVARTVRIPPPAYSVWGFMYSLSANAQLAAIPLRPKDLPAGPADPQPAGIPFRQKDVPAGQTATSEHDGTIRVWDLRAGKEIRAIPFPKAGYGTGHAFTPDGKVLITSTEDRYFQVWDVATGTETARSPVAGRDEAAAVVVSADGRRFATARRDGRVDIWETSTGKPVVPLATHRDILDAVSVSPDGRLAATLGQDETIRVWEMATGKPIHSIPAKRDKNLPAHRLANLRLAFTPDGRGLLFPAAGELTMVDPSSGKPVDLPGQLRGAKGAGGGFAAAGRTLATYDGAVVTLWDWPAATVRAELTIPLSGNQPWVADAKVIRLEGLALSPDGRLLFTSSTRWSTGPRGDGFQNGTDVWDARTGKHLHQLSPPASEARPAVFAPDGRVMYLGGIGVNAPGAERSLADALTVWDPEADKLRRRFVVSDSDRKPFNGADAESRPMAAHVTSVAVSPDGRLLAAAEGSFSSDRSCGVWVYETASGRVLAKFVGHANWVTDLAFSPDGRRLVSVAGDQTGLVWDVTPPALVRASGAKAAPGLAAAWDQLAGSDPVPGYAGVAALAAAPAGAVPLLREKLRPAPVPTEADLDRLVGQLAAAEFADREKASAELDRFGSNAVVGARARLTLATSPDVRDRLTQFLNRYNGPVASPYQIRAVRGVAALEAIGTADARAVLAELAKGPATDPLVQAAAAAARRAGVPVSVRE
ncbi:MAG: hypothetical protein JWO38_7748, partial [Gemmataceae bacterium]|nr:hypothetical protein [Gemmataceae bacterium]